MVRLAFRGRSLLGRPIYNKDAAFTADERDWFGLHGLLPTLVMTIEQQLELELEHVRRKGDDLEKFIGLAALQDRNETLFFRLLAEHLEEFMPIVYTPTVGRACQEYSHIFRRPRGVWITPADAHRIPEVLRNASQTEVRLIVATDNERILGLGDQGAGGMGIPIGKLALYTAGAGIHPASTLPVSLDVGTDNVALLGDPFYLGWRNPRLRGPEYDAFLEAFVDGVRAVFPRAVLQWEDFKQHNAIRILDRYRDVLPSFNDDIQGTAGVVVGGILAGLGHLGRSVTTEGFVSLGAGAAAIGIIRLIHTAQSEAGLDPVAARRSTILFDTKGLVHRDRPGIEADKASVALAEEDLVALGLTPDSTPVEAIRAIRAGTLIGTTQTPGTFAEPLLRALAAGCDRPLVFPLSNPTSRAEATPEQVLAWTDERALCATGSPFPPILCEGRPRVIGQANNSFIFPGVGLGAIVAGARTIRDRDFLVAARTLAGLVAPERLACGALYPRVADLRAISRAIAIAVVEEIGEIDGKPLPAGDEGTAVASAAVDAATWWPDYDAYEPA
ncbi:MAG: NAD-dependent malic enzyme [Chloroflexi bacterium]|nr:NAD-dependent malic enzyme [Chloroflexota bacterium]